MPGFQGIGAVVNGFRPPSDVLLVLDGLHSCIHIIKKSRELWGKTMACYLQAVLRLGSDFGNYTFMLRPAECPPKTQKIQGCQRKYIKTLN